MKLNVIAYTMLLSMLVGTLSTFTMEQETALSFDLDDVVNAKEKVGFADYAGLATAFFRNPTLLALVKPSNFERINKEAHEIGESINGASNIVHKYLKILEEQGYGNLANYEDDIIGRSIKPRPLPDMIQAIQKLKKKGYTVIGATNQDRKQHEIYRKKMNEKHGVDIKELFHAVVATRVHADEVPKDDFYQVTATDNMYVITNPETYKPRVQYFQVVQKVVQKIAPQVSTIIHTDDQSANCNGATQANLKSIHFKLPAGSAQKSSEEDIAATIKTWKAALAEYKIKL